MNENKIVYLTRKEHFNAAHKLYNKNWSEQENEAVFGKCANKNWHGHNYDIFVTIKGTPNIETGYFLNVKDLSKIIKEKVCLEFDHKNLNEDLPYFKEIQPSTENLAIIIWDILLKHLPQNSLHKITLYETENIFVEYYG